MKKTKKIILFGYGRVAKEILLLLKDKRVFLENKYNIEFVVTGIVGSTFILYEEKGLNIEKLVNYKLGSSELEKYALANNLSNNHLSDIKGDILVECTPTNIETGEPGYSYIKWGLENNMDIVCVSKGALVKYFDNLMDSKKSSRIKYSGATMAALPAMDVGDYSLASTQIISIEGVLNGTSNYILTEMYNNKLDFNTILQKCIEQGIAEKSIEYDIKGIDSANKLYLLTKSLITRDIDYEDIKIEGIENINKDIITEIKSRNNKIKLIGRADKNGIEVRPEEITPNNPLYNVENKEKGIIYYTKDMGKIFVSGGESSPRGAASAAIKDLINLSYD